MVRALHIAFTMRPTFALLASLLALVPACPGLGCGSPDEEAALASAQAQFAEAQPASYSFTWKEGCFCGADQVRAVRISVTGDAITSAVFMDDQTPATAATTDIRTIDGVFALIQHGFDKHYDVVQGAYDPTVGYPMTVFLDPKQAAADDETQLTLSDFATPADAD